MKLKKCKGSGNAKGFGCGEHKVLFKYGLCISCYPKFLFESEQGKELIKKATLKSSRIVSKEKKKSDKKELFELLPYPKRIAKARQVFQKWIRNRDKDKPCISCGTPFMDKVDAGHYKKAEIYTNVIFDEINTNSQCVQCNQYLHGNEVEYRKGLINRYGIEVVEALEERAKKGVYRYSIDELKNIIDKYGL